MQGAVVYIKYNIPGHNGEKSILVPYSKTTFHKRLNLALKALVSDFSNKIEELTESKAIVLHDNKAEDT